MIVKILSSTGTFAAVRYNTGKVDRGDGELMKVVNMPQFEGRHDLPPGEARAYLMAHSATNARVKNAQFHATISAKGREMDKCQLTEAAVGYMDKMGYGENPYIVVFHGDTDNNHVHIVSSRVDNNGRKINDSHERRRSQAARAQLMEEFGLKADKGLEGLLAYRCQNESQMARLLEHNGYTVARKDEGLEIWHNGQRKAVLARAELKFPEPDRKRAGQLKALFAKYAARHSTELVPLRQKLPGGREASGTTGYRSDFGDFMKAALGIELVYHFSGDKRPFGYTVIDHSTKSVLKGSDVLKLAVLLNGRPAPRRKERTADGNGLPEKAAAYNIGSLGHLQALARYHKIPEYRLSLNDRKLTAAERNYYRVLLEHHFRTGGWGDIEKIGIVPVMHDGELLLLDRGSQTIIDAAEFLPGEILGAYLPGHPERGLSMESEPLAHGIEWGWSMADDVDDERAFGRERNREKTGRKWG